MNIESGRMNDDSNGEGRPGIEGWLPRARSSPNTPDDWESPERRRARLSDNRTAETFCVPHGVEIVEDTRGIRFRGSARDLLRLTEELRKLWRSPNGSTVRAGAWILRVGDAHMSSLPREITMQWRAWGMLASTFAECLNYPERKVVYFSDFGYSLPIDPYAADVGIEVMGVTLDELVTSDIEHAWQQAAGDLGIDVMSPYYVETPSKTLKVSAFVPRFGSLRGTVVVGPRVPREVLIDGSMILSAGWFSDLDSLGYFIVDLRPPYDVYERERYVALLDDLQWTDASTPSPSWYTGKKMGKNSPGRGTVRRGRRGPRPPVAPSVE
jgi:hypothetical protein